MLQKTIYKDTFRTGDPAGHISVSIQHCLITGNSLAFGEVHSSSPNDRDTPRTHCELLSLSGKHHSRHLHKPGWCLGDRISRAAVSPSSIADKCSYVAQGCTTEQLKLLRKLITRGVPESQSNASQTQHHWHFGLDYPLLWKVVLCICTMTGSFLASNPQTSTASNQLRQEKCPRCHWDI